jgi:hypothetical protein
VTTGCDPLACVLHKVGIDGGEIGVSSNGPQRVVVYEGLGGGGAPVGAGSASALWNDGKELAKFDVALFASECADHAETKTNPSVAKAYAEAGGILFLTGSQAIWPAKLVTAWSATAAWGANVTASSPYSIVVNFPRGKALADWLIGPEVQGSTTYAQLPVTSAGAHAGAVDPKIASPWVTATGGATTVLSFSTPHAVPPDKQCGRVKYFDVVSSGAVDPTFPSGCTGPLTPEEKVIAFHLFEMRGCAQFDGPPPVGHGPK